MADPGDQPLSGQQVDALLDAIGPEEGDRMLAELLRAESPDGDRYAVAPQDIRARLKELAGRRPDLIARIIMRWLEDGKRRG
jgi:hypothetical protein